MKIGFVGLGIMGKPMAKNLLKAGHAVFAYDLVPACVEDVVAAGAEAVASPKEAAEKSDLVITMVPNGPQVKQAVLGENGVLCGAKKGQLIVDMSSIAPTASQEVYKACKEQGVRFMDAPVSGGEPGAIAGTLSIMCGGDKPDFDEAYDILKVMGASVVYCGEIGAGNTTKLANQIIVALNIAAVSEAFMLAVKAGVNPRTVFDAIKGGLAGSHVMDAKAPMMLDGNFKPGFKIDLHIKDLNNAIETGHAVGAPLLLTAEALEILERLHFDGHGQDDHSAIALFYEKLAGDTIKHE
jgi:2-hydroxy-3-oxopropionate reductase